MSWFKTHLPDPADKPLASGPTVMEDREEKL